MKTYIGKILIGCEYSGITREAFKNKGWYAVSADLLPTEINGKHYKGNVLDIINKGWDMAIFFPPCTYLTYAGMANWYDEGRAEKRIEAIKFFMQCYNSPIDMVCVENPQGIIDKIFRKHSQEIHPFYFGDREMKRTHLWLKNLPKLQYQMQDDLFAQRTATDKPKPILQTINKKTGAVKNRYFTDAVFNIKKSGHIRSKTFPSVAKAMAEQWTEFYISKK